MPILDGRAIGELRTLAASHLRGRASAKLLSTLGVGASAAVFEVLEDDRRIALKVYDPAFFEGTNGPAEKRRLKLQEKLIGHDCEALIQVYAVNFDGVTCFIEMEHIPGPDLNSVLKDVPRGMIQPLIRQLVSAVRYLETRGIVHRDIKPQNIKISDDFKKLTLLDLGVIRELEHDGGPDATEQGSRRPFIATAQYSSPEYLFWIHSPSKDLWHGLSIYQVGAVLHDLLTRRPLFADEVAMENRYALARAVLEVVPSTHADDVPAWLCALSARCLTKDLHRRLTMVSWDNFDDTSDRALRIAQRFQQVRETGIAAVQGEVDLQERTRRRRTLMDAVHERLCAKARTTFEGCQLERISSGQIRVLKLRIPNTNLVLQFQIEHRWSELTREDSATVLTLTRMHPENVSAPSMAAVTDVCTLTENTVEVSVATLLLRLIDNVGSALDVAQLKQGALNDIVTLD